ncbi:MAG: poly(3-hydroxyalkanoate) synthetase [Pseudomonas sp.]|nr:poly(3-hydroxyalkanoate) synthetase [Pseudomonas sp.]
MIYPLNVALHDAKMTTVNGVFEHLNHLQRLNTRKLVDAVQKRQATTFAPANLGQLAPPTAADWQDYFTDLGQRSVLFWDTLRQRGDNTLAHERAGYPLLLKFEHQTLLTGTDLPRPVNYSLLQILGDAGQRVDPSKQPVIIIDPRGGHGAGIGGFKQDSVIGESLRAGHPTYFIAFSHSPAPGQTLADIVDAQARFIEVVSERHPDSSKPVVIGNCQAGWALMGLAATRPELPGLIIVNGAPLSYWAGVNGRNPMRYTGGLLGGGWMARLGSDLGNNRFDGTWLVSNFEGLDPANTYWGKYYHLFSEVDSEAARFLDFERWWGSPTLLNGEEIEMIVDDLFIGNQLSGGLGRKSSGLDLKRIEVPVVVFCSYGDNITSPQQALDWITDVYPSDLALQSAGRTIVYLRHATIGHLGIFVSGEVARREHRELLGAVDTINGLPAGLYEMLIDEQPEDSQTPYAVRFEARRIADIHDDVTPPRDDDREFALVERASSFNNNLYDGFVRPWLRQWVNEPSAELMRKAHPFHQQQVLWSSMNPALWWVAASAAKISEERRPARKDNPLLAWQALFSNQIQDALNGFRDARDAAQELCFYGVYGVLNSLTGPLVERNLQAHGEQHDKALIERLEDALPLGGLMEALIRILFLLSRDGDEAGRQSVEKRIRQLQALLADYSAEPQNLRETLQLQKLLVVTHPQGSLSSLPLLLADAEERQHVLTAVADLVPEWCSNDAAQHSLWCELHALLGVSLPGIDLTQPPGDADVVKAQILTTSPEPIAEVVPPTHKPAKGKKGEKKPSTR